MWLVLCDPNDASALWAFLGLKKLGLAPLELVSSDALAYALRWAHAVRVEGTETQIGLADGRQISTETIAGALNRLVSLPLAHFGRASAADRSYATQEFYALQVSWLNALPGTVVNRPTPGGLSGPWRHGCEWALLGHRAGLLTRPILEESEGDGASDSTVSARELTRVVVLGSQVFGATVPTDVEEGCRKLTALASSPLLGLDFLVRPDGLWTFMCATSLPDLRLGGNRLLDSLKSVLKHGSESEG